MGPDGRSIASLRAAFGAGWWMGFGYFLAGLWWVGSALLVEADKFAWALPLAVVALPAALAVFPAAGFALARLLWSPGPSRIFALAFGLGVAEWARGLLFTGFPWNDLGMALGVNLALAQTASLVGLHGLTFLTIAIFAAPATLWRVSESRLNLAPTIVAALALALIAAFGELQAHGAGERHVPGVKLRLIQPNVGQDDATFGPENKQAILRRYFDLSERATSPDRSGVRDVTHLIWPESAFPFILSRDPQALSEIVDFLGPGATLITGAARRRGRKRTAPLLQFDRDCRPQRAVGCSATTSSIWCRSENICRSRTCWSGRMSPSWSTFRADSKPARAGAFSTFRACRTPCRSSATRRSFPSSSATSCPAPSGRAGSSTSPTTPGSA